MPVTNTTLPKTYFHVKMHEAVYTYRVPDKSILIRIQRQPHGVQGLVSIYDSILSTPLYGSLPIREFGLALHPVSKWRGHLFDEILCHIRYTC